MAKKDRTKQLFADALYKLLESKEFEKIQVKDICENCQSLRQTFYYHFHDKYELIAWIFDQDYNMIFSASTSYTQQEMLVLILKKMYKKRSFYKQVFNDHSQNSIAKYIHDFDVAMNINLVMKTYNLDILSDEQLYLIKYHSYGTIQMTIEWLLKKHIMSAEEFAHLQFLSMPDFIRNAYLAK